MDDEWDGCFGCGQKNPIGLKLKFEWDGKTACAEYSPGINYQGWPGVVHGGIIANMLDEASGWAMVFSGMYGVTARMEILYHNPAPVNTPLIITGGITKKSGKRITTCGKVTTEDGTLIAESEILLINMKKGAPAAANNNPFAVIWDMDGVIVDTGDFHFRSWRYALKKQGIDLTKADFQKRFGQRNDAIVRSVLNKDVSQYKINEIANDKETYFRKTVKNKVKALPGAVELIKSLAERGVKMAVASSAPLENIELLIGSLGLKDSFREIVPGKEVTESKPSPMLFLLAAKKLGFKPEKCIVVEDAVTGVAAAKRAKMRCIAVTNTNPREKLLATDLIIDSLTELDYDSFEKIIK